jgi:hypothetical protein
VRPLVEWLIICEPRHNRLINSNPQKSDEADVEGMCLLLRLGKLKEVWMGTDRTREIYRALVYELLNWRDAQRELKALIKARYRQWGVLKLHGIKVFSPQARDDYLAQLALCQQATDLEIQPAIDHRSHQRQQAGIQATAR